MTTYTYRIETHFPENNTWDLPADDARGTDDYDGTAQELAEEVLNNWVDDQVSLGLTGRYKVLVWEGDTENDAESADAQAEKATPEEPARGRGRPSIGPEVKTRLSQDEVDRVDTIADRDGLTRAHIIREAVQTYLAKRPTSDYTAVVADPETVEWLTATTGLDRLGGATGTRYGLTDLGGGRVHIPASAVEALAEFDDDEDGVIRTVDGQPTMYVEGIDYPLVPAEG